MPDDIRQLLTGEVAPAGQPYQEEGGLDENQPDGMEEIRWISALLAEKYFDYTGDFDIEFNVRQQLTEELQLELLQKRVDILSSMMFNQGKLKISLETVQEVVGLEYEIDESIEDDVDPNLDRMGIAEKNLKDKDEDTEEDDEEE